MKGLELIGSTYLINTTNNILIFLNTQVMNIKDQNIYTDLFFNRPVYVLDCLDEEIEHFTNHFNHVSLHGENPEEYYIPYRHPSQGAVNAALSKIMDVEKYIEMYTEEYGAINISDSGVITLNLIKLFDDFGEVFDVKIKVDSENRKTIFVDEHQFAKIFDITYKNEFPSVEDFSEQLTLTNKLIEAAKQHAYSVLGDTQFKNNVYAAQTIANDFIKGAVYILEEFKNINGDMVQTVDKNLELNIDQIKA